MDHGLYTNKDKLVHRERLRLMLFWHKYDVASKVIESGDTYYVGRMLFMQCMNREQNMPLTSSPGLRGSGCIFSRTLQTFISL